jgi:hypothetical protein
VNEHVLAAIVANDEAEALLAVEELYGALGFTNDLRGHAAAAAAATAAAETTAAAAAIATAAAATAEAIATAAEAVAATAEAIAATTVAAATAEAIAAATVTAATTTTITAVAVIAEAVALVPAAALPAPPSIETHAVQIFPKLIRPVHEKPTRRGPLTNFRPAIHATPFASLQEFAICRE